MTSTQNERKPLTLLSAMIVTGIALLSIPWFLTPPAYLDLALRDSAFDADLTKGRLTLTDDQTGKAMVVPINRIGDVFVAHVGRINSGTGAYTARLEGYKPGIARVQAAALQRVRVPVDLKPTFGRLEISTFNAMRAAEPVDAIVKDRTHAITPSPQRVVTVDLPPGGIVSRRRHPDTVPPSGSSTFGPGRPPRLLCRSLPISRRMKWPVSSSAGATSRRTSIRTSGKRIHPVFRVP